MLLLIDNYDSFVHNLERYCARLGQETQVVRNDAITVARIRELNPAAIVLSPGPCSPTEAGESLAIVRELYREVPILGICLGHQTIAAALGGRIVRAQEPLHGRSSTIKHKGTGIFFGQPIPLTVGRYHSLIVERKTLPAEFDITAWTDDGTIMALQHRSYPVCGVQFHPESILTENGYSLLANFLQIIGSPTDNAIPSRADELMLPVPLESPLPVTPVTF